MLLDDDFLLTTSWAKRLYHNHASRMPIIDYHCHLVPAEIYEDKRFENLAQVWLYDNGFGDHYKWRLMRANGTAESVIRGDDDYAKFEAYVSALERAVGNPLYEWSHLELRRIFDIDLIICKKNAQEIWERANAKIASKDFSAKQLIRAFDVRCLCTTDDPASDLMYHKLLVEQEQENGFRVLPTFRPDALMAADDPGFCGYVEGVGALAGIEVHDWASLKDAVASRIEYFHAVGGRLADHGANSFYYRKADDHEMDRIVTSALVGEMVSGEDLLVYQSGLTLFLMSEYARRNWTLQIHANCLRNDSTLNLAAYGRDAGFDSVGDQAGLATELARLLDAAQMQGGLPRCVLYSLNNNDLLALASLAGSFQGDGMRARMQLGCAWWFNDHFDGMKQQLTVAAHQGLLGSFCGMLTDSRSFLSYPRHEYFRRVLCHTIGEWVEAGRVPDDEGFLGGIVEDICYNNARDLFGFFEK